MKAAPTKQQQNGILSSFDFLKTDCNAVKKKEAHPQIQAKTTNFYQTDNKENYPLKVIKKSCLNASKKRKVRENNNKKKSFFPSFPRQLLSLQFNLATVRLLKNSNDLLTMVDHQIQPITIFIALIPIFLPSYLATISHLVFIFLFFFNFQFPTFFPSKCHANNFCFLS